MIIIQLCAAPHSILTARTSKFFPSAHAKAKKKKPKNRSSEYDLLGQGHQASKPESVFGLIYIHKHTHTECVYILLWLTYTLHNT